jgi:hypothetical protein
MVDDRPRWAQHVRWMASVSPFFVSPLIGSSRMVDFCRRRRRRGKRMESILQMSSAS